MEDNNNNNNKETPNEIIKNTVANIQKQGKNESNNYNNDANVSLIVGIFSLLFSTVPLLNLVLAIIAIVKAKKIPKENRSGKATAGMVMGIITIIIAVISTIVILILTIGFGIFIYNIASSNGNVGSNIYNNVVNEIESGYYNFGNEIQIEHSNEGYNYADEIFNLYEIVKDENSNSINNVTSPESTENTTKGERIFKNKEKNITYTLPIE